jgi:hypothetical protein
MVSKAMRVAALAAILALPLLMASGSGASPIGGAGTSAAAVTQSGLLNYAGPNCPGAGWNCTTSTNVVQFAAAGGENRFECAPAATGTSPPTTCMVDQHGDTNHARCFISDTTEPTSTETCHISQDGRRNYSDVHMTTRQGLGPTQKATQTALVDQTATDRNQSQVIQDVKQGTSIAASQSQDAYQLADVSQDATGSSNFSHVHQSLDQSESGSSTSQLQNQATQPYCFDKQANQCARVLQTVDDSAGGTNDSHLEQATGERQTTSALTGAQTQGLVSNGQEGHIHQVNPAGLGENHDSSHLDLRQRAASPNGTTTQHQDTDPRCCGISQIGGRINRENIDEGTDQSADEASAVQNADLFGEAHQVDTEGDAPTAAAPTATPDDKCSIDQHGRNNSDSGHFSADGTGAECATLVLETQCTSAGGEGACGPPICVDCIDLVQILPAALPTAGLDIAMPDYTALPADYVDPGGWW